MGHPRSPGIPLSFPLCLARLSSGTCRSHLLWEPVSAPPLYLGPVTALVQNGFCMITEGLATPTPVPQTLTHNIHLEPQSQARAGSEPYPGSAAHCGLVTRPLPVQQHSLVISSFPCQQFRGLGGSTASHGSSSLLCKFQ